SASRGVFVEVGGGAAAVAVDVQAEYGTPVPGLVSAVREGVIRQVETLTGLRVSEVNVTVSDVILPDVQQG
ncbi:MAG: Asp23/Gls24 family envelope stress response protein, partial [Rubrobacter sp.]|nr:Asp23/Gls24 family envelope stress response protein [Rubrobacter sp.]